jgi:hypothetical protein
VASQYLDVKEARSEKLVEQQEQSERPNGPKDALTAQRE